MIDSTGTIVVNSDGGISFADIMYALGSASTDIGTLVVQPNVNPYAKFKPISVADPGFGRDLQNRAAAYKAQDYGYIIPELTHTEALNYMFEGAIPDRYKPTTDVELPAGWIYNRPTEIDWARTQDFIGYNHNSQKILIGSQVQSGGKDITIITKGSTIVASINTNGVFVPTDFKKFDGLYLVAVIGSSKSVYQIKTCAYKISASGGLQISITMPYDKDSKLAFFIKKDSTYLMPLPTPVYNIGAVAAIPDVYPTFSFGYRERRMITATIRLRNKGTGSAQNVKATVYWGDGDTQSFDFGTIAAGAETEPKSYSHSYRMTDEGVKEFEKTGLSYTVQVGSTTTAYTMTVSSSMPII